MTKLHLTLMPLNRTKWKLNRRPIIHSTRLDHVLILNNGIDQIYDIKQIIKLISTYQIFIPNIFGPIIAITSQSP